MANNAKTAKSEVLRDGWREQWRYAWTHAIKDMLRQPLTTLLTVMVIAISLTLPSLCYIGLKNISTAATQWYPQPQLTVYLDKSLNDDAAMRVMDVIKMEAGVEKVNYLSCRVKRFGASSAVGQVLVARWICWKRIRCWRWRSLRQR